MLSRALLTEDHRTAQLDSHQYGNDQQHGREHDERAAGEKNIQQTLDVMGVNAPFSLFHRNNFLFLPFPEWDIHAKQARTT